MVHSRLSSSVANVSLNRLCSRRLWTYIFKTRKDEEEKEEREEKTKVLRVGRVVGGAD